MEQQLTNGAMTTPWILHVKKLEWSWMICWWGLYSVQFKEVSWRQRWIIFRGQLQVSNEQNCGKGGLQGWLLLEEGQRS